MLQLLFLQNFGSNLYIQRAAGILHRSWWLVQRTYIAQNHWMISTGQKCCSRWLFSNMEKQSEHSFIFLRSALVALSCPTLWGPMGYGSRQAPLSIEFSRQEYQSGQPFPSQGDLSNPGIELGHPTLQADSSPPEPAGEPIQNTRLS